MLEMSFCSASCLGHGDYLPNSSARLQRLLAKGGIYHCSEDSIFIQLRVFFIWVLCSNLFNLAFCCPNCDNCFNRQHNLEELFEKCSEKVGKDYSRNVIEIAESLFDKLERFADEKKSHRKRIKSSATRATEEKQLGWLWE